MLINDDRFGVFAPFFGHLRSVREYGRDFFGELLARHVPLAQLSTELAAFLACEPFKTLGKRDNSCVAGDLDLVHYAEHDECFHFTPCRWRGAPEQFLNVGCFQCPVFFDQVPEEFGAGSLSGIKGDFQDRPEILPCYLPPTTQECVTASEIIEAAIYSVGLFNYGDRVTDALVVITSPNLNCAAQGSE